jgi:hypothetical protein
MARLTALQNCNTNRVTDTINKMICTCSKYEGDTSYITGRVKQEQEKHIKLSYLFTAVNIHIVAFWVVTPYGWWVPTFWWNIASIFYPEDGSRMCY